MVLYTCKICLKEFNRKCNYINHTENKKTPCKPILQIPPTNPQNTPKNPQNPPAILQNTKEFPKDSVENNNFTCNFCFSSFKRKDHLKRHINERCKVKKLEDEKKENIFNSLIEKEKINNLFNMYEEIKKSNEEKNKIIEELNKKNDELNKKMKKLLKRIQGDYNRCKFMVHDGNNWNLSQNEELIIFQVLEHVRKLYFSKIDDEEFEQKFEKDQVFSKEFFNFQNKDIVFFNFGVIK